MASYTVTEEHIYVFKCNLVILDLLPTILRKILASKIDEKDIHNVAQCYSAVLGLSKERWKIIRTCVYSNFDTAILYSLIRNVTDTEQPEKGWGKVSPLSEKCTMGDVVENIRDIRNEASHFTDAIMPESNFQKFLQKFTEICKAVDALLPGSNYSDQLRGILQVEFSHEKALELKKRRDADDTRMEEIFGLLQELDMRISLTEKVMASKQPGETYSFTDEEKGSLKGILLENYKQSVMITPISPRVQNFGLPIDILYVPLKVKEKTYIKHHQPIPRHESGNIEERIWTTYDELLSRKGRGVQRIFLYGDAGSGKTCYALRMATLWAKGHPESDIRKEKELNEIDYVFFISMKYLSGDDATVEDIVCNDFLFSQYDENARSTARKALRSPQTRCLVIFDGLDEWPKNKLPSTGNLRNCQVLFTSRSSKIATMNLRYEETDKIGNLQKFSQEDTENLVPIILQSFFKLKVDTPEYQIRLQEILDKLRLPNVQHISRLPFLATYLVIVLHDNLKAADSVTSLYLEVLNILIRRSLAENRLSSSTESGLRRPSKRKQTLKIQSFKDKHFNALLHIGCYAFECLQIEMKKPVLQVKPLDEYVVDFGIETGILRKSIIPEMTKSHRKFDFLHRSILEILAAIFLVYTDSADKLQVLLKCFSTVDDMLQSGLLCTFVAGLDPHCGQILQKHLGRLSKSDRMDETCGFSFHHDIRPRMKTTYDLFCNLISETSSSELSSRSPVSHGLQVHVYLDEDTDENIRTITPLMLEKFRDNISSVFFENTPGDDDDLHGNVLDNFLANQLRAHMPSSLQHLYIKGKHLKFTTMPPLTTLILRDVLIEDAAGLTSSIENNPHLKVLRLSRISCGGRYINLNFHESTKLESLTLETIHLTSTSYLSIQSTVQGNTSIRTLRLAELNKSNEFLKRKVFDFKLENKTGLKELGLQGINLDPAALQCHRDFLASNANLVELHLDEVTFGKGDLVISSKRYLRILHLANVELSDRSMQNLSVLIQATPQLENLILENIRVDDTVLELDLSRKERLTTLYLSSVRIENMRLFGNMYALSNIVLIDISMCDQDWNVFINDLTRIQRVFDIDLHCVNIKEEHVASISDSRCFRLDNSPTKDTSHRYSICFSTTLCDT